MEKKELLEKLGFSPEYVKVYNKFNSEVIEIDSTSIVNQISNIEINDVNTYEFNETLNNADYTFAGSVK